MLGLKGRIFLFLAGFVLLLEAVAFGVVYRLISNQESIYINDRLDMASTLFLNYSRNRAEFLEDFVGKIAKNSQLPQLLQGDKQRLVAELNAHREQIEADIAIAISANGTVIGEVVKRVSGQGDHDAQSGFEEGRLGQQPVIPEGTYFYSLYNGIYQLSIASLQFENKFIGWIAFGYLIDDQFAQGVSFATDLITRVLLQESDGWRLLASSSFEGLKGVSVSEVLQGDLSEDVVATHLKLGYVDGRQLIVVFHGFKDKLFSAVHQFSSGLILFGVFLLVFGLGVAYALTVVFVKPVNLLLEGIRNSDLKEGDDWKGMIGSAREISCLGNEFARMRTELEAKEKEIDYRASHNLLTHLPNRSRLVFEINQLVNTDMPVFGLFQVGVGNMHEVNDTLGHKVGDEVIKEVAVRLLAIDFIDFVAHLGTVQFACIMNEVDEFKVAARVKSLLRQFEEPFVHRNISLQLHIRIGVALYPAHGEEAFVLMQKSDAALHMAQKEKLAYQLYDEALDVNAVYRLKLMNDIKQAIIKSQLILYYQPKINLKNRRVEQLEALVRWQHPKLGMIPPDDFIGICEQVGQINLLTMWVIREALHQCSLFQKKGFDLSISVNISAENLKDPSFCDAVLNILGAYDLPLNVLCLEITESAVVENDVLVNQVLTRLKSKGIRLSIDDYGTGYSSLAQLKRLPVHELKIDKAFVMKLPYDEGDRIITHSTIELAHNMGLSVVAEGVESQEAIDWLAEQGCEMAQGYHICRPKPAEELEDWLLRSDYFELNDLQVPHCKMIGD